MSDDCYRQRVNLTIDSRVWAECKEKRKKYQLNWSQIAEQAFVAVLLQLNEVERIVKSSSTSSGNLDSLVVKSQLSDYIARTCVGLENELKEISQELEAQIPD